METSFSYFWITDSCPHTVKTIADKAPFEVLSLAGSIADALVIWIDGLLLNYANMMRIVLILMYEWMLDDILFGEIDGLIVCRLSSSALSNIPDLSFLYKLHIVLKNRGLSIKSAKAEWISE